MAITVLTSENIKETISSKESTIIDFWAEWCGPCKALSPVLEELSGKYEGAVAVGKVNVSDNIDLAKSYNVSSIPCLIVFRNGKEVDRVVGFKGEAAMEDLFIKHS